MEVKPLPGFILQFETGAELLISKSIQMETKTQNQKKPALQKELVIDRVLNLPINKVWQAWTEAKSFKKWWGPKDFTCPSSRMEAKVGGKYLNCMRSPNGKEFWSTGVVEEIITEKKLAITDSFSDEKGNIIPASAYGMEGDWPMECHITASFEKMGDKTKMSLRHEGIPPEMHDECRQGWNESLDKLEKNLK